MLAQPLEMATRKVSGLVREHADDFVRRLGVEKGSGVDEDVAAIHDEGIERAVAEHHDPHILLRKTGGVQDRLRVVAQQLFDFGVTDNWHPARCTILRACGGGRGSAPGRPNRNRG